MTANPWTDPDRQPGDVDGELAALDPHYIDRLEGDPAAKLIVLVGVEGDDARRLERIAEARGQ